MKQKTKLLIFGTMLVLLFAGALIFFGMRLEKYMEQHGTSGNTGDDVLAQKIDEGIERYVQKQKEAQDKAAADSQQAQAAKATNVPAVQKTDHIRGLATAPIFLIEYSDFECPYCKSFHGTTTTMLKDFNGKVALVYRHFPLSFHDPMATREAEASECVNELGGNEKFWQYADLIFERTTSNGHGLTPEQLPKFAAEIGINQKAFNTCLESEKYKEHIQKDITDGVNSGVTGTPGNILWNAQTGKTRVIPGAVPLNVLEGAIQEFMKE